MTGENRLLHNASKKHENIYMNISGVSLSRMYGYYLVNVILGVPGFDSIDL